MVESSNDASKQQDESEESKLGCYLDEGKCLGYLQDL